MTCYAAVDSTIIRKYHDELDACAKLLIEKEKITREEFEALFEGDGDIRRLELCGERCYEQRCIIL